MRFFDSGRLYHRPDVFSRLSAEDKKRLEIDDPARQIAFTPVVTDALKPVCTAFIGLNAYCGDDYRAARRQPNFTEWCQDRYNPKIFTVMQRYADQQSAIGISPDSYYFTNYVKVVLPEGHFKGESAVVSALNSSKSAEAVLDAILKQEVEDLMAAGCRAFVCFGNAASAFFDRVASSSFGGTATTDVPNVEHLQVRTDRPILVLREKHYAYFSYERTQQLAAALASYFQWLAAMKARRSQGGIQSRSVEAGASRTIEHAQSAAPCAAGREPSSVSAP